MGLFIVIFTNTPRNVYQNLIFAGIPFIFTLQRYMYTVPVLIQKKKTCFHEQFLAPFLKRHHYNSYGSQELVAAPTHAELKVCPPLPPPSSKTTYHNHLCHFHIGVSLDPYWQAPKVFFVSLWSFSFIWSLFYLLIKLQDIAFKIVNREWEYSHRHGFRCQFQNNIFQLWFHFKRYRYRR